MAKKQRVAIIGTGMIAQGAHIPAWKNLADDVEIVGCMDILPERSEAIAKANDIPNHYGDYQKMLDELQPDIVSVCTPNVYHKAPVLAALKAGAHVCCEKPITISTKDAEEMYAASDEAGKELFITQTTRFTNDNLAARKFAQSGKLGKMYYAETSWFRRRGVPTWGVFHIKSENAGGPVYDLGVHMLDLIIWVMGNPKITTVSGSTYLELANKDEGLATSVEDSGAYVGALTPRPYDYREFDVEDFAVGLMRLENGGTVVLRTSWAANVTEDVNKTFVMGTGGGLEIRPKLRYISNVGSYQGTTELRVPSDRSAGFAGHFVHHAHVLKVIRGEEEKIVKREQVLNIMAALEALYESGEKGHEIKIA